MQNLVRYIANATASVAAFCLVALMLLTFADVVGRYFLNAALPFAVELIQLGMGLLIFLGLALTTFEKGHISVDLVSSAVPASIGKFLTVMGAAFGTLFFGIMAWQLFVRAMSFKADGLATQVLFLPVFPVAFVMALSAAFVTMICVYQFFQPGRGGE